MITKISDYNFDITDFDLFKSTPNYIPKEFVTIIDSFAATFFLTLEPTHFKLCSVPFLLNAQNLHQKTDIPLSQKNAQVILKIAICIIVGVLAIKAKAIILVPISVYLISKNLNFTKSTPAKKVPIDQSPISALHTPSPPSAQNSDSEESVKRNKLSWNLFSGQGQPYTASHDSDGEPADNSSGGIQLFFGEDSIASKTFEGIITNHPPILNLQEIGENTDNSQEQEGIPSKALPLEMKSLFKSNPRTPQSGNRKHASGKIETFDLPEVQGGGVAAGAQPGKKNRHRRKNKGTEVSQNPK